jgi:hypothetical protein
MPYAKRASLGAPAVTNGPSGLPWLKEFLGNCTGCQIDFVPLHWYNRWNNTGYLHEYLEAAYVVGGGRKLWLTEVCCSRSSETWYGESNGAEADMGLVQCVREYDGADYIFERGYTVDG